MELTKRDRDTLKREIKKRIGNKSFELPEGFTIDSLIGFLFLRHKENIRKIRKMETIKEMKKGDSNPAWSDKLMEKADKALGAFLRFERVLSEIKKQRLVKIKKQLEYLDPNMAILLGKDSKVQPFNYNRLAGKAELREEDEVPTEEEVKEVLRSVEALFADRKDAMRFINSLKDQVEVKGMGHDETLRYYVDAVKRLKQAMKEAGIKRYTGSKVESLVYTPEEYELFGTEEVEKEDKEKEDKQEAGAWSPIHSDEEGNEVEEEELDKHTPHKRELVEGTLEEMMLFKSATAGGLSNELQAFWEYLETRGMKPTPEEKRKILKKLLEVLSVGQVGRIFQDFKDRYELDIKGRLDSIKKVRHTSVKQMVVDLLERVGFNSLSACCISEAVHFLNGVLPNLSARPLIAAGKILFSSLPSCSLSSLVTAFLKGLKWFSAVYLVLVPKNAFPLSAESLTGISL